MTLEQHPLTKEFPKHQHLINQLKHEDDEFAELHSEYHELDRRIYRLENHEQPVSDQHLSELKHRRAQLKDLLYRKLVRADS